uniref:Sus2 n=1 Tax=Arundo donax TaxID=35708 RepID=A0A0A9DKB4_ARUDO
MWCGCRMHFPLFTYLHATAAEPPNKNQGTSVRQRERVIRVRRGSAYLERRATSSLRWAWRVSSTRSRMLGVRSSFGTGMAVVSCVRTAAAGGGGGDGGED